MLQRLGFHIIWIKWIKGCVETTSVSVLVNGSPTEEFYPMRGLRQRDPLAPFLFLLVAEGFSGLDRQAIKSNMLTGVKVRGDEVDYCLLRFANDTVFKCEDSFSNVFTLKAILRCFELPSRLKINFHKSMLAGVNVVRNNLECYSKCLNCNLMMIPFKYMGIEVGSNLRKKEFWEPIVNKLSARLSAWKGRFLSLAQRICLIKLVLIALPMFYLSFYRAPESIYNRLICIQRRFLWGWGKENRPHGSVGIMSANLWRKEG